MTRFCHGMTGCCQRSVCYISKTSRRSTEGKHIEKDGMVLAIQCWKTRTSGPVHDRPEPMKRVIE